VQEDLGGGGDFQPSVSSAKISSVISKVHIFCPIWVKFGTDAHLIPRSIKCRFRDSLCGERRTLRERNEILRIFSKFVVRFDKVPTRDAPWGVGGGGELI
jgi:hypothetical protein